MKRLKIFGLLAMISLLAFGLALSCDSSTPADDEPDTRAPVAHYSLDNGRLGLYFSQDPSRLPRATATSAEEGDHYVLIEELSMRVLSAGTANVGGVNGNAITLNPNQTEFPGQESFTAAVNSDGGITVVGAPDGSGGTIDTPITGEREGSGAYQPGQGGQGGQGGSGGNGGQTAAKYTVTFKDSLDDSIIRTDNNVASGSKVTPPADPTKAGYDFIGWFYEDGGVWKPFTADTAVTKNLTVYADWEDIQSGLWAEFADRNAAIAIRQLSGETVDAAELKALKDDVLAALKDSNFQSWITAGQLSANVPLEANGDAKTNLNYLQSQNTTKKISLDVPRGVSVPAQGDVEFEDSSLTVDLNGVDWPGKVVNIEYKIGIDNSSDVTWTLQFVPVVDVTVVFTGAATGTVKVQDVISAKSTSVDKKYICVPGEIVITLTSLPDGSMAEINPRLIENDKFKEGTADEKTVKNSPSSNPSDNQAASPIAFKVEDTVITLAAATSKPYTITVSPSGGIVSFNDNFTSESYASEAKIASNKPRITVVGAQGTIGAANMPSAPRRGGYTFNGWNTNATGTGTPFTGDTIVTGDIDVWADWISLPPSKPWERFAHWNDVIKDMTGSTTAAVNQLKGVIETHFSTMMGAPLISGSDLNPPASTTPAYWLNPGTALVPELLREADGTKIVYGYIDSKLDTTGANARKIPMRTGTGAMPAGVYLGDHTLRPDPASSVNQMVKTGFRYDIGTGGVYAEFPVWFYPSAQIDLKFAASGDNGTGITVEGATSSIDMTGVTATATTMTGYVNLEEITITVDDALMGNVAGGKITITEDGQPFNAVMTTRTQATDEGEIRFTPGSHVYVVTITKGT